MGSWYDLFGIHSKHPAPDSITISAARFGVSRVDSSIQSTVESVKATFGIEDNSTNGPEGTISSLTQGSLDMFHEGMNACTGRDNNELPCIPPSFKRCMRDHTSRVSRLFSARSRWAPGTTCMPFPTSRVRHLVSCGMQSTSGLSLKSH